MRLVTLRTPDGTRAGRVDGDDVVVLGAPDVGALLDAGLVGAGAEGASRPLASAALAPVVPAPSKVFCLGLNYEHHIRETARELPQHPTLFAKFADALAGPRDRIVLPKASQAVDWEGELVIVIGRRVRDADPDEAAAAIAGFTVGNDVSMRDWQMRTLQWLQGKTWERSSPVGPALVTTDEVGGPEPDLQLRVTVDDEVVQEARTGDLLFKPVFTVSYISTIVTLQPGDLIFTGTPGGVGAARQPPRFLRPGEVVRTTIEGVGELVNEFVQE
jgi:acylpyruvate hydrolase